MVHHGERPSRNHCRRQLLANAAIAASRVGSCPCAAGRISPLCPLTLGIPDPTGSDRNWGRFFMLLSKGHLKA